VVPGISTMTLQDLIEKTYESSHNDPRNESFGVYLIAAAILELINALERRENGHDDDVQG
jgi:hypothetical protein